MANSGIVWIDITFNWAVYGLVWLARLFAITYEEINVWIFCIGWPLATLLMLAGILKLWHENQKLKNQLVASYKSTEATLLRSSIDA